MERFRSSQTSRVRPYIPVPRTDRAIAVQACARATTGCVVMGVEHHYHDVCEGDSHLHRGELRLDTSTADKIMRLVSHMRTYASWNVYLNGRIIFALSELTPYLAL